jgi:hypothetical protein
LGQACSLSSSAFSSCWSADMGKGYRRLPQLFDGVIDLSFGALKALEA